MNNYRRDQNGNIITMYCIDCRKEGRSWEDSIAVVMCDNTTRCMQHTDEFIKRNNL